MPDDPEAGEDESGAEAHVDSIQGKYLRLVYGRLKYELSAKISALEKKWLLESLELNEYWLRRSQALSRPTPAPPHPEPPRPAPSHPISAPCPRSPPLQWHTLSHTPST